MHGRINQHRNAFCPLQGEYIAPEKLETIYSHSKYVAQCFVDGNSLRVNITALWTLRSGTRTQQQWCNLLPFLVIRRDLNWNKHWSDCTLNNNDNLYSTMSQPYGQAHWNLRKKPPPKNTMKPVIKAANPSIHNPVPVREQMIQV